MYKFNVLIHLLTSNQQDLKGNRSMYNPALVQPMREELSSLGIKELLTPEEVDLTLKDAKGTTMVVVNSVCGCAAGGLRPGVAESLKNETVPTTVTTVFAGQDKEATERARSYFHGYPPSSPSVAILKDGDIVFMLQRRDIEGYSPSEIATKLKEAYNTHC
jgi:putative YphP/YqiW family bacilliredoxin